MIHRTRRWCVSTVSTAEELARMLTEQTWTGSSAFVVNDFDRPVDLAGRLDTPDQQARCHLCA